MSSLTIHTATYNRAHTLPKVYESLCKQTCFDFEWFVTDNGSTDNTKELFDIWCAQEKRFKIQYHYIEERGIPRALNYGINHIDSDYVFILDSDDIITPDAVGKIYDGISQIEGKANYVGIGFVKINQLGNPLKGVWPKMGEKGYVDCTNLERAKYDLDADMCEAYKVSIIKKYPFPVWKNEIFAPEALCMNAMALDGYKLRWYKDAIHISEYHEDGLTKGAWNLLKNNKMGYAMLSNQKLLYPISFKQKLKEAGQHIALSIVAGYPGYIFKSNKPWISIIALPYGLALAVRRYFQFKR